jgi:hypothetical protein
MGSVSRFLQRLSLIGLGICIGLLIAALSAPALRVGTLADLFGPGLVRAQAVIFTNGQDDVVDLVRGRIISVGALSLVVRERDGTVVTVPVDPAARITLGGVPVHFGALRRKMHVQTLQLNDNPAHRVEATLR